MPAGSVAIIADVERGALPAAIFDLAAMADGIADKDTGEVRWFAVGRRATEAGARLAGESGYPVTALEIPSTVAPTGELGCELLLPFLTDMQPDVIALLHTSQSQDAAAALAIALDAAWIAGIQGIVAQGPDLLFQRAVFGGRLLAEIRTDGRPAVVTVQPGYFKCDGSPKAPAAIETLRPPLPATLIRLIETWPSEAEAALKEAKTIIAAGRGIGSRDNLTLVDKLAACFPGSAVAGSRIVCDAGWMPYHRQVGLTGATVAPKLYVACGISGAHQHVAGMQGAELIVAINKDPQAAIFNLADIGVVEDLEVFLPLLIEALENMK